MPIASRLSDAATSSLSVAKVALTKAATRRSSEPDDALSGSDRLRAIIAERAAIHAAFDQAARRGLVPDALIERLHDNHLRELAEQHRLLGEVELAFASHLRGLEAAFPPPPPPEPTPAPPKHYRRISEMFGVN